jgi:enoyl-CoA hydratase
MEFTNILVEQNDHVQTITINRPNQLNALNKQTISELHEALKNANNDTKTGVIILTGSGDKAFVAGADIKEFASFSVEEGKKLAAEGQNLLFSFIENMTTPVIAAINGFALGGGLELAMASHIRIASANAKMGLPETSLGVIPGYGGTQRLTQLVGRGKANEMIFTAGMIDANDAMKWGLVNHVCEQVELLDLANEIAAKILKNSGTAIASAIRSVNSFYQDGGQTGFDTEIKEFGACFGTADFTEGTTAFIEKRKPKFRG